MRVRPNKLTPGANLLWEGSRMMLPEHREQLLHEKRQEKKFHPPLLDEDQLQQINRAILEAIAHKRTVTVTYAETYGPARIRGWIEQVKPDEKRLKIVNKEHRLVLSFERILDVEID